MHKTNPINYEALFPRQIVFGWGRRRELATLAKPFGSRAYIVLGSRTLARSSIWHELLDDLERAKISTEHLATITHEPTTEDVDSLVRSLRSKDARVGNWILAIGGGSAIDLAKAAAALITQPSQHEVINYLEGVGELAKITSPPLPCVAMPTTGGTGSECTKNAVISSNDPPFKKSLRDNRMIPELVIVDPELSVTVSSTTTAWTGLDAITQLIESFITRNARPIPSALCIAGLQQAWPALREAVRDGASRLAREAMAHAAMLSGIALANSGLGFAHGVAAALGVTAQVPHGLACAAMLPTALRVNRSTSESQLATLARAVKITSTVDDTVAADEFIVAVEQLCADLSVPARLRELGVRHDQLPQIALGSRGNSMNGNPRQLTDPELLDLLESRW